MSTLSAATDWMDTTQTDNGCRQQFNGAAITIRHQTDSNAESERGAGPNFRNAIIKH